MDDDNEDPFHLQRFVDAQEAVFEQVCKELRGGEKRTHWMWFVFPQIQGLGFSEMAHRFALASREEASAYLMHPVLGVRLTECTRLVNAVQGRSIRQIFASPDDMKFHSSMTLFAHATPDNPIFVDALHRYFGGKFDLATLKRF